MRELYHVYGCRYVTINRKDKKECCQCQGSGVSSNDYDTCIQCNGHGWLWDSQGYAFKPYTLESVYN